MGFQTEEPQAILISVLYGTGTASLMFSQKALELLNICLFPLLKYEQIIRHVKKFSNMKKRDKNNHLEKK